MKKNIASSTEICSVLLSGCFKVEYSMSRDGVYSRFILAFLHRPKTISDFISYIRRNLVCAPTWVRSHVPAEFQDWSACFWFRFPTSVGYLYFSVDISSSDLKSCFSSREAAL